MAADFQVYGDGVMSTPAPTHIETGWFGHTMTSLDATDESYRLLAASILHVKIVCLVSENAFSSARD